MNTSIKTLLLMSAILAALFSSKAAFAAKNSEVDVNFTLVMINMNGVPDLLRLPKIMGAKGPIPVSIGMKRWEENFYLVVDTSGDDSLSWKMEQRQINCLIDPADSTVLPAWPKRRSEWREMPFVGTGRYKGVLFGEDDLSKLDPKDLETYARSSSSPEANLKIALRLAEKETANSYHCETEIRVSMRQPKSARVLESVDAVYRINVNSF